MSNRRKRLNKRRMVATRGPMFTHAPKRGIGRRIERALHWKRPGR